jgi:hypothetical protein
VWKELVGYIWPTKENKIALRSVAEELIYTEFADKFSSCI